MRQFVFTVLVVLALTTATVTFADTVHPGDLPKLWVRSSSSSKSSSCKKKPTMSPSLPHKCDYSNECDIGSQCYTLGCCGTLGCAACDSTGSCTKCREGFTPYAGACRYGLVYNGGPLLPNVHVRPIFWGSKWADPAYAGDKITGLRTFFNALNGSNYYNLLSQYFNGTKPTIDTPNVTVDSSPFVFKADDNALTNYVFSRVCDAARSFNDTKAVSTYYYPVYIDFKRPSNVNYCAWHWLGQCHGVKGATTFSFHFDFAGDLGCATPSTANNFSQALKSLIPITLHELKETVTDPNPPSGWTTPTKEQDEIGDRCEWDMGDVKLKNNIVYTVEALYDNTRGCVFS